MTDRELLELAAKAAGYRVHGWINGRLYVVTVAPTDDNFDPFEWNPRDDDGDALRLSVHLGLLGAPEHVIDFIAAKGHDDPYAATRRAIVRAAAEIGRAIG